MISLKELNKRGYMLTTELASNMAVLHKAINVVREAYGKPMIVTSGLRSKKDQERINPSAMGSKHLSAQAVDIEDTDGELAKWVKANVSVLETAGLWCEDLDHTRGWVHFQCVPPKSGNRFFIP
jgi:hypothetical protein